MIVRESTIIRVVTTSERQKKTKKTAPRQPLPPPPSYGILLLLFLLLTSDPTVPPPPPPPPPPPEASKGVILASVDFLRVVVRQVERRQMVKWARWRIWEKRVWRVVVVVPGEKKGEEVW